MSLLELGDRLGHMLDQVERAFEFVGLLILEGIGLGGAGAGFTFGATGISLASVVGAVVVTAGLIGLQLALAPKPPKPADGHIALRQPIPDRIGVYGTVRPGGKYMLYEMAGATSFDVIAIVSGKICGFRVYYLHEDIVVLDVDGFVISTPEFTDGRYISHVQIVTRLGLSTETAYSQVTSALPAIWTSAHRGDGTASLMLKCDGVKTTEFQKVFPQGKPEPSAALEGFGLYDPRDPTHNPEVPSTWTDYVPWSSGTTYGPGDRILFGGAPYYSRTGANIGNPPWALNIDGTQIVEDHTNWCNILRNPVLQWMDFYTNADYGMGLERGILFTPIIDAILAQANLCDELVAKKDGSFEPRYQSSSFWTFTNDPQDVLGPILAACDGWTSETGDGPLTIQVGVYSPPTVTISDRHIHLFEINSGVIDEERVNELTLSFTSPKHKYAEVPGDPWRDDVDISETGKRRSQPLALINVQSHSQARRLAKRALLRLQAPLYGTFVCKLYALLVFGQRFINIQFSLYPGLENAVVEIQPDPEIDIVAGTVKFDWKIVNPNIIDAWDPDTEEGTEPPVVDGAGVDDLPVPANVDGVIGGTVPFHIDVSWDDPGEEDLTYVIRYRLTDTGSGAGPWTESAQTNPTLDGGRYTGTIFPTTTDVYDIEVASVGPRGTESDFSDPIVISTGGDVRITEDGQVRITEAGDIRVLEI